MRATWLVGIGLSAALLAAPAWATEEIVMESVFDPDMMSYVVDMHNIQRRTESYPPLSCTYWMPVLPQQLAWVTLEFEFQRPIETAELISGINCHFAQIPSEAWLWVGPSPNNLTLVHHIVSNHEAGFEPTDISEIVRGSQSVFVKAELWRGAWDSFPEEVQFMRYCTDGIGHTPVPFALIVETDEPQPMNIVQVPAGSFIMGDGAAACGANEHSVTLTHEFYLGQYEVTNQQYLETLQWAYDHGYVAVVGSTVRDSLDGSTEPILYLEDSGSEIGFSGGRFALRDAGHMINPYHPVKQITWYGAAAYCDWLSLKDGLPRAYDHATWICNGGSPYHAVGYRLPTDAEWEYAAQWNDERIYSWGNEAADCGQANWWCVENPGWSRTIGSYPGAPTINGQKLYDMAGNAWEWCNDWHTCALGTDAVVDPPGPGSGTYRVFRGGAFDTGASNLRCAARDLLRTPDFHYSTIGLRIARTMADWPVATVLQVSAFPLKSGSVELTWITDGSSGAWTGFDVWRQEVVAGASTVRLTESPITGGPEFRFVDSSIQTGGEYNYWVEAISRAGSRERFGPVTVRAETRLPLLVSQNAPNPFSSVTQIALSLKATGPLTLQVFDAQGRLVKTLHDGLLTAGSHAFTWDGRTATGQPAPSGVYFGRVSSPVGGKTQRMLLVR